MDDRVTCTAFGRCGGCRYGSEPYEEQLAAKEQELIKLFRTVLPEEFFACGAYEGMLGSPLQWGSRNKMEFSFGNESKDGPLTLGLHRKGSFYDIIPVPDCRIPRRSSRYSPSFRSWGSPRQPAPRMKKNSRQRSSEPQAARQPISLKTPSSSNTPPQ